MLDWQDKYKAVSSAQLTLSSRQVASKLPMTSSLHVSAPLAMQVSQPATL